MKNIALITGVTGQDGSYLSEFLLEKGSDFKYGARPLRRAIQRYIEDEISEKILLKDFSDGDNIVISKNNDILTKVNKREVLLKMKSYTCLEKN